MKSLLIIVGVTSLFFIASCSGGNTPQNVSNAQTLSPGAESPDQAITNLENQWVGATRVRAEPRAEAKLDLCHGNIVLPSTRIGSPNSDFTVAVAPSDSPRFCNISFALIRNLAVLFMMAFLHVGGNDQKYVTKQIPVAAFI